MQISAQMIRLNKDVTHHFLLDRSSVESYKYGLNHFDQMLLSCC